MFENPRTGSQAKKFTKNVLKILDLKSSSEQIFSENWRWVLLVIKLLITSGATIVACQADVIFYRLGHYLNTREYDGFGSEWAATSMGTSYFHWLIGFNSYR